MERELHLTVDLGNGSAKLALWAVGERQPRGRLVYPTDSPPSAAELVRDLERADLPRPQVIHVCSVAGEKVLSRWEQTALGLAGADLRLAPDPGLAIECRSQHTIGRDRLFAAQGAAGLLGQSCVVLDAGTALTVDAVVQGGAAQAKTAPNDTARFLGGAIAPGPELLAKSLADAGAQLWRVALEPDVPALGRESEAAMRAGCVVGFRGAAFELARRVGIEAGIPEAPRVLCGGAARFLLEPEPFWPDGVVHEPDLVHLGLLAAAGLPLK